MARPLPTTLSPSKVSAFKDCPLAFRFSVIDRIPEPPSPAASRGTLVHRALELLMLRPSADRTIEAALGDLERARAELADDPEFTGLDLTDDERAEFQAGAEQLVCNLFAIEDPAAIRAVGLEVMLSVQLDGVTVRGIIDRLEIDDDGEFVVTDYKTGRAPRAGFEKSRLSGVEFYALLCEEVLGRRPARVQLLHLAEPELIVYEPSAGTVRGVRQRAGAVWEAVRRACATDDFRPHPGPLCDWCTFQAYCPAFGGDPERVTELVTGTFPEHLPVG
ncbi:MAG: PD-(D/E)XK nuclease family protein [Actinobacteria bacterium]|nr:PD-(D/E)XK nuclease family protein [Actinomycetota bacterium]